eukprot:scaffold136433_cov69-Phaeocystis_antarctica.AAC.2
MPHGDAVHHAQHETLPALEGHDRGAHLDALLLPGHLRRQLRCRDAEADGKVDHLRAGEGLGGGARVEGEEAHRCQSIQPTATSARASCILIARSLPKFSISSRISAASSLRLDVGRVGGGRTACTLERRLGFARGEEGLRSVGKGDARALVRVLGAHHLAAIRVAPRYFNLAVQRWCRQGVDQIVP